MGEASPYLGNWTVQDGSQAVTELTKKPPSASVWGPPTSPAQHMQAETLTRSATCRKVASLPITPSCSPHLPPNSTGSSVFAKRFLSWTDRGKKKSLVTLFSKHRMLLKSPPSAQDSQQQGHTLRAAPLARSRWQPFRPPASGCVTAEWAQWSTRRPDTKPTRDDPRMPY